MPQQFNGQRSNESVILTTRLHPCVLLKPFLQTAFIFLIPALLYVFLDTGPILSWTIAVCLILGLLRAFLAWHAWWNSLVILTDQRVLFLEQRSIVNREFSECSLVSISQVSHQIKGVFNTLFGFGSIEITTGGSPRPFTLPNMPSPYELQNEIQQVTGKLFGE